MTESMPQCGQIAVSPPLGSAIHSSISVGSKIFRQWKHPHRSLVLSSARCFEDQPCAVLMSVSSTPLGGTRLGFFGVDDGSFMGSRDSPVAAPNLVLRVPRQQPGRALALP